MRQEQAVLFDKISKLPFEKLGKVISFVGYLEQEAETELWLEPKEAEELDMIYNSGDFVDSSELLAKIKDLSDD